MERFVGGNCCRLPYCITKRIEDYDYDCYFAGLLCWPDGSGLDLLEKLKEMHKRENVIILSAKDSIEDKVLGLELGADDYLPKPFHLVELNARIKSVIRRHQQGGENSIKYGNIEIFPDKYGVTVAGKNKDLIYFPLAMTAYHTFLYVAIQFHQIKGFGIIISSELQS